MGALRALLVAVPGDLDFTARDTARLKDALLASGYDPADVTVADTAERTSAGSLPAELNAFLAGCRDGDVALVYVSAHGVRAAGVDFLVPSGYDRAAGVAGLVAVRPDELLAGLTSTATVLLCLDTCRDDAGGELGPGPVAPALTRARENVVLVHACAPGQRAMGTAAGSFLGRALAEALGPESPPRTVEEVLAHVRRRTAQIAGAHGAAGRIEVTWLTGTTQDPPAEHAQRKVCRPGPGGEPWAEAVHRAALWDRVAPDALDPATLGELKDLLGLLVERVLLVRRDAARAEKAGPDPWDDPRLPLRVLGQLDRLVPPAVECPLSPLEALTLLATPFVREAAVACGRRALAELYPARGPERPPEPRPPARPGPLGGSRSLGALTRIGYLSRIRDVRPAAPRTPAWRTGQDGAGDVPAGAGGHGAGGAPGTTPGSGSWGGSDGQPGPADAKRHMAADMADVRKAFGQIETKRLRVLAAGDTDSAVAAEQWLRHRLLDGWDELWDGWRDVPDGGPALAALHSLRDVLDQLTEAAALAVGLDPGQRPHSRARLRAAVLQVVAQMRTRPSDTAASGEPWENGLARLLAVGHGMRWRPRALTELLHMAELLAIDPRALDGIVVDHLGVRHHQVAPADLVRQAADADFRPVSHRAPPPGSTHPAPADWTLVAECRNAALHVALERLTDTANRTARNIAASDPYEPLFRVLPRHINTDALEPALDGARYEAPPPRFQLAEDGVQPLIMGTQLYGDRMLAVRELYQNALDACRRRHARQRYAALTAPPGTEPVTVRDLADYTVTLTLANDPADGRRYVECRDDGIGMTAEELRDLFARAGRRNEQSPARVRELRRWRRAGVVPELNSRFGIGVFSYFMLAEEIRVTTRPAGIKGRGASGPGHRVDVVADSGLMHITTEDDGEVGTRIRLYLRPEFGTEPPALVDFVNEHVLYSPVRLVVEERTGQPRGEDRPGGTLRFSEQVATPPTDPERNVWWVRGQGMRLVDGIVVAGERRPYGYVVNLLGRHRAVLGASRNELNGFAADRVRQDVVAAVPEVHRPVAINWLWSMVRDDPGTALEVIGALLAADADIATGWLRLRRRNVRTHLGSLAEYGCFPLDQSHFEELAAYEEDQDEEGEKDDQEDDTSPDFFMAWRRELRRSRRRPGARARIRVPRGFPRPSALDAIVFRSPVPSSWAAGSAAIEAAVDTGQSLRMAVRALRRYAVVGVIVPAADDIRALDDIPCTQLTTDLYRRYGPEDDGPPAASDQAPSPHGPLLATAGRSRLPIADVTRLVDRLRLLDPRIPEPPAPGDLGPYIPTAEDLEILGGRLRGSDLPHVVTPMIAAVRALEAGLEAGDVAAFAQRYARLGYLASGDLTGPEIAPVVMGSLGIADLDDARPYLDGPFTADWLLHLAAEQFDGDSIAALARIDLLAPRLGLKVEVDAVRHGSLLRHAIPSWWGDLANMVDLRAGRPGSAWTVLRVLSGLSVDDIAVEDVRDLAVAGVVHEDAVEAVRELLERAFPPDLLVTDTWLADGLDEDEMEFDRAFSPDGGRTVGTAFLFALCVDQRELEQATTIGGVYDIVREEAEPLGIAVAPVPPACHDLSPGPPELEALFADDGNGWRAEATLGHVADYAEAARLDMATAAARLRAYEPLGAPAIPGDPALDGEPFEGRHPTVEWLFRFAPLRDGTLTPLALTITAVRMELGLRSAYAALAPYTRLGLVLACPEPADDDHAPDWRDVVLLTRQLTGAEPALDGEVDAGHVELAAEETDLTAERVRDRLAHYAPLFGFTVEKPAPLSVPPEEGTAYARA